MNEEDENENVAKIPFEELVDIDLDDIDDIEDGDLYAYFMELASKATEGQLRVVLGLGPADDDMSRPDMVHGYASRGSTLVVKMRALRPKDEVV